MEQIATDIYRTENLKINNTSYTVRFTATRDGQQHTLFVSNNSSGRQKLYRFSKEEADDFQMQNGFKLEDHIFEVIKKDMSKSLI